MKETGRDGYQKKVKDRIKSEFPSCQIIRLDPNEIQGIPDLLLLCPGKWATLETKKNVSAVKQPNQSYYVDLHNKNAFSRFVRPENEDDVFKSLNEYINNTKRKDKK